MDYYTAPFTKLKKIILGQLKIGYETSFQHLQFSSKYDAYVIFLQCDWWSQIQDDPRPVWQGMLLRTLQTPFAHVKGLGTDRAQSGLYPVEIWYLNMTSFMCNSSYIALWSLN